MTTKEDRANAIRLFLLLPPSIRECTKFIHSIPESPGSNMNNIKLCKDCKWFVPPREEASPIFYAEARCAKTYEFRPTLDIVTGKTEDTLFVDSGRTYLSLASVQRRKAWGWIDRKLFRVNRCGKEGRWWELCEGGEK